MTLYNHSKKIDKIFHSVKLHNADADEWVPVQSLDIGDIKYSAKSADHNGWFKCDGRAISRSTYATLFAVISTAFGSGDGTTTFNLPDCRGRVLGAIGTGSGLTARSLGQNVGAETHILTTSEIPAHSHGITDPGHTHTVGNTVNANGTDTPDGLDDSGAGEIDTNTLYTTTSSSATTGITVNSAGGGGAHNNMQPTAFIGNVFIYGSYAHVH